MRFIQKGEEPMLSLKDGRSMRLSEWRLCGDDGTAPSSWNALRDPMKGELMRFLKQEQGTVCCYCGIRITVPPQTAIDFDDLDWEGCHIEHVWPKAHAPDERMFYYSNLLLSCNGGHTDNSTDQTHCGHRKLNWPRPEDEHLFVCPFDPALEDFHYTYGGRVVPRPGLEPARHEAIEETIRNLNLDCARLQVNRQLVIEDLLEELDEMPYEAQTTWAQELLSLTPEAANDFVLPPFLAALQSRLRAEGFRL